MLKWIVERLEGIGGGCRTRRSDGCRPPGSLDLEGMGAARADRDRLLDVDPELWREEAARIAEAYAEFGDRLPNGLWDEHRDLVAAS